MASFGIVAWEYPLVQLFQCQCMLPSPFKSHHHDVALVFSVCNSFESPLSGFDCIASAAIPLATTVCPGH